MAKYKKDALGTRMKTQYENRSRNYFPRRGYTLVRIDGKAFHTWTRGLKKPYDLDLMDCMDQATIELCKSIMGCICGFVQSDEISLLITDFSDIETQAWFDGSQSKIESITASIATMAFNKRVLYYNNIYHNQCRASELKDSTCLIGKKDTNALFDSRAWVMADPEEVANYFIWRQKDAERNSLTMLASSYASHKDLHGKKAADRHDVIHEAGDNWNDHPANFKRGRMIQKSEPNELGRSEWKINTETPIFVDNREYLSNLIPRLN